MKRTIRYILVFTLFVIAAQPTFACVICDFQNGCTWGGGLRCKPQMDGFTCGGPCGGALTEPLAAEFTIASVEVTQGADVQVAAAATKDAAQVIVADAHLRKNRK
jgi:hypothetical protein